MAVRDSSVPQGPESPVHPCGSGGSSPPPAPPGISARVASASDREHRDLDGINTNYEVHYPDPSSAVTSPPGPGSWGRAVPGGAAVAPSPALTAWGAPARPDRPTARPAPGPHSRERLLGARAAPQHHHGPLRLGSGSGSGRRPEPGPGSPSASSTPGPHRRHRARYRPREVTSRGREHGSPAPGVAGGGARRMLRGAPGIGARWLPDPINPA